MRILLLEDDPDTLEITTRILRHIGHTVASFRDGETLIEHCSKGEAFDLLISDIGLPGENGMQVLAKLRSRCQSFKAIAATAYARDVDVAQCRETSVTPTLSRRTIPCIPQVVQWTNQTIFNASDGKTEDLFVRRLAVKKQ